MGPALAPMHATNGLAWAQGWPQCMLPMVLHGPITGPPACYRWSSMGPVLATKHATGLERTHLWPLSLLLMTLIGSTSGQYIHFANGFEWAHLGHEICP